MFVYMLLRESVLVPTVPVFPFNSFTILKHFLEILSGRPWKLLIVILLES